MRDDETAPTEETLVTEQPAVDTLTGVPPELVPFLTAEMTAQIAKGQPLTEQQLDALADARRADAESDAGATVHQLPVVRSSEPAGVLSIRPGQTEWNDEQLGALMVHCGLGDVPKGEAWAFLHLCQRTELDPWAREIYLIGRQETVNGQKRMKYTAQTGIDGFRHIAERSGEYEGKEGPWWCGADGQWQDVWLLDEPPVAARIVVHRAGVRPLTATVMYREFVPMKKVYDGYGDSRRKKRNPDGSDVEEPQGLWGKMPAHMLAKCAEALAIRQAFPRQAAGIYVTEEMEQADARAANDAEEQARLQRAEQRRQLVGIRPPAEGPGDPASPAVTAQGEVIEGTVIQPDEEPVDREALMAELEEQARLHATSVSAMTRRWVAANRKNLEDATDQELAVLVRERRASSVERAAAEVAASTEVPAADPDPEISQDRGQDGPVSDVPPGPGPVDPETEAEREARREAVEARARAVAADERRKRDRPARTKTTPTPEQGTLGDTPS